MSTPSKLSGSVETDYAEGYDAASASSITLLAADANDIPFIHGITVSSDTAGTYELKIGGTTVKRIIIGANGGYEGLYYPLYLTRGTKNQAVTLTKHSGATTAAGIWYTLERDI